MYHIYYVCDSGPSTNWTWAYEGREGPNWKISLELGVTKESNGGIVQHVYFVRELVGYLWWYFGYI